MEAPANFILIDDEQICNILSEYTIKKIFANAAITTFTKPLEGVTFIKTELILNPIKFIIFLDINMPLLNGWEVLDLINNMPPSITQYLTVCMLSSSVNPLDREKALSYPVVTAYIEKPLNANTLQTIFA